MKNIWEIFKGDMRNLMTNVICAIVAMGLIIVPPMYAWLTSLGFWDPYSNTGGITVAVANQDAGYEGGLVSSRVDAGAQVVAKLHENDQFNWVFEDKDAALEGVRSGAYYAAIVIPDSFSTDLMTAAGNDEGKPQIEYYINEKENAIAPHVTGQGATELQTQIDQAFSRTVADIALGVGSDAAGYLSGGGVTSFAEQLDVQLGDAEDELRRSSDELQAFGALTGSANTLAASTGRMLDTLAGECRTIAAAIKNAQGAATDATSQKAYEDAVSKLPQEAQGQLPSWAEVAGDMGNTAGKAESLADQLEQAADSMASTADTLAGELGGISGSLDDTGSVLGTAADNLAAVREKLQHSADSGSLEEVRRIIGSNPDVLAGFLSAPTQLVEHPVFKVDNNGSSMSPFYTSLSLWVGAIFLVALTSVTLTPKRLATLHDPTPTQIYLGRAGVFMLIAIAQAVVVCVGNVFFIGVQCEHFWMYLLAGVTAAFVFTSLAYTLAASFGVVGKAIMVIGLVMQIGGAGGIFPVQLSAPLFQDIYPWLPLTHSMQALQSAMFGAYGDQYWMALLCLLAYLAGALVLGLVLRRPVMKLNAYVQHKLDDTRVL